MKHLSKHLYELQNGRCYLRTVESCRVVDGYLHPDQLGKGARSPRGWTWEHVVPRKTCKRIMQGTSLRLLACEKCNQRKSARQPTDAELRLAYELNRSHELADIKALDEFVRRYGLLRPLAITGDLAVLQCDDADVPKTVKEALAQGGIKA